MLRRRPADSLSGSRLTRRENDQAASPASRLPPAALTVIHADDQAAQDSSLSPALALCGPTRRLAETGLRLVVGDDVARLEPEQVVDRAGAEGVGDGAGPPIVAG